MLDLSWAEMGVILVTATLAIGPKDLPIVLRKVGRAWAQFKRFGADIKTQFDQSALGAELRAAQEEVERESRVIYDEHGVEYQTFSLDGITDASRATPILPKEPLPSLIPESPHVIPGLSRDLETAAPGSRHEAGMTHGETEARDE